jgi:hypothetical protein
MGQPTYERVVADVRTALGEESFGRVGAKGRTMTLEPAVTYAVEEETNPDTTSGSSPGGTKREDKQLGPGQDTGGELAGEALIALLDLSVATSWGRKLGVNVT